MKFLFDSHGFFEEVSYIPFFQGLVAVFFNGGITFLTTILTLLWLAAYSQDTAIEVLDTIGTELFAYSFLSSFVTWFIIAFILFLVIFVAGKRRLEMFEVISMAGLGFVPLAFASLIELIATAYLSVQTPATGAATTTHVLIGGEFGMTPALIMFGIHGISLIWSGHIWVGATQQLGGVSPGKATFTAAGLIALLFIELVFLALL